MPCDLTMGELGAWLRKGLVVYLSKQLVKENYIMRFASRMLYCN